MKAIDAILKQAWAIQPEWLETICAIAERESEFSGNLDALEKKLGRPLGNTERSSVRDGIAIIPVEGALFPKANLMTEFSGATSYQMLALEFETALADPSVSQIVLNVNSPGGSVEGVSQFAAYVAQARGQKPITAFVGGTAASAAYWIASAADQIVASDTALIGSIGVQMGMTVADPKPGVKNLRFVSSNAPLKNADPASNVGATGYQRIVDDLEAVFLATVAENRGVDVEAVKAQYGQGAVFVASDALKRGMIDKIGSLEGLLTSLISSEGTMDYKSLTAELLAQNRPDLVASLQEAAVAGVDKTAIRAEGAAAERERIAQIEALAMPGAEDLIATLKADANMTAQLAALAVVKHLQTNPAAASGTPKGSQHLQTLAATEQGMQAPVALGASDQDKPVQDADAVIAFARQQGSIR